MEFIKEYGASNSEEDKPVTPHTSEQYKASENDRPPSPQSDGTEQAQGHKATEETSDKDERPEVVMVVDEMPEVVDYLTDEEMRHLWNEMGILSPPPGELWQSFLEGVPEYVPKREESCDRPPSPQSDGTEQAQGHKATEETSDND